MSEELKLSERVRSGEFDLCVDGQSCNDPTETDAIGIADEIAQLESQRDALLEAGRRVDLALHEYLQTNKADKAKTLSLAIDHHRYTLKSVEEK